MTASDRVHASGKALNTTPGRAYCGRTGVQVDDWAKVTCDDVYVEEENTVATTENGTNVPVLAPEPQGGELTREADSPSSENDRSGHVPPDPSVVRAWAKANGVLVSPRGRVPRSVVDAYLAAHTKTLGDVAEEFEKRRVGMPKDTAMVAADLSIEVLAAERDEALSALEFVLRADVEIAQLSHALQTAQRQPWFRRRAS